ncbi:MAG: TIGR00366 family protein [Phenylobacterium sp.]|nr:TIGR00366 family protein [Phenylobacterium sp.]
MKLRMPHTLALLLGVMVLALVATWLLPPGAYQMAETAQGQKVVVPGTYAPFENRAYLPPWTLFTVIPKAFASAQGVIFFVILMGGVFGVLQKTGAIEAAIGRTMIRFQGRQTLLIFFGMAMFTLLSASFGMASEYIAFTAMLVALCAAVRLDAMTASGILLVGYGVGYGASTTNPFTVVVAQEIAGVPIGSGLWFRVIVLLIAFLVGFHHVWSYARRARLQPERALAPPPAAEGATPTDFPPMTLTRGLVLGALGLTVAALIAGIILAKWSLPQVSALFLGLGFAAVVIGRLRVDEACDAFLAGAARLTGTALLVGVARAIGMILEDGQVLHTLVFLTATPLAALPSEVSAVGMFLIQALLNVFIPSGSGQAFATMPIMAPIGDLVGVSRQASVLAFQFGDGFTNLIIPTNPFLMAILGLTGVTYGAWVRFVWPLMVKLMLVSAAAMVTAVLIGL